MGILDELEKGLERVVGGAFAKTFSSGLQPLEITAALRRELDTRAAVLSRERILVPHHFRVRISQSDHERLSALGQALLTEIIQDIRQHAASQHYSFANTLQITLSPDTKLSPGMLQIDTETTQKDIAWVPTLEIGARRHRLKLGKNIIGRGNEADITLSDPGTSRKHIQVYWDGQAAQLSDLSSTNGTKLDGVRISNTQLHPGSVIQIGHTRMVFQIVPETTEKEPRLDPGARTRQDRMR